MKKLLSFFLSIALLSTLSFTAYATEVAPSVPQEHAIPSIPEEISFSHNRIIKGFTRSASNNLRVMNEYEILQSASAKSDAELLQEGYGEDTISQIRDGTIAELIRKSIFSRASLPSIELSELGYTESEIEYMREPKLLPTSQPAEFLLTAIHTTHLFLTLIISQKIKHTLFAIMDGSGINAPIGY